MTYLKLRIWAINTSFNDLKGDYVSQHDVENVAQNKGYIYLERKSDYADNTILFLKKKHARKVAKKLNIDMDNVYHEEYSISTD